MIPVTGPGNLEATMHHESKLMRDTATRELYRVITGVDPDFGNKPVITDTYAKVAFIVDTLVTAAVAETVAQWQAAAHARAPERP